jgi:mannose/fructose/N-acetylgalactosamine-specific phosphotransferase system component IID
MASLSRLDLLKIVYRTLYIQGTWNYERKLALGFCSCLTPFAKKYIQDNAQRANFLKRNLKFFNAHPYMAGWVVGATIKLEQEALFGDQMNLEEIDKFKARLSELSGAVGDRLFWRQLKPITAMIGLAVTLYSNIAGLLAFLILYNLPHIFVRVKGVYTGYRLGFAVVKEVSLKRYQPLLEHLDKIGCFVTGALLVLIGNSHYISGLAELAGFIGGAALMYFLIRWSIAVPLALMALIALACLVSLPFF